MSLSNFDLQLSEQLSLVKNAQEDLQHSLALLNKSYTKETKRRAKLLIQTRMSKAQDLLKLFQSVMEIRAELTQAYKDLINAKALGKLCKDKHRQVQWLEQRLEKFITSYKRHYPECRKQQSRPMYSQRQDVVTPTVEECGEMFGFIPPRPAELFGISSWNTLSLAINTNFLESDMTEVSATKEIASWNTTLEGVCKERQFLEMLIQNAAQATSEHGVLLPAIPSKAFNGQANSLLHTGNVISEHSNIRTFSGGPCPQTPLGLTCAFRYRKGSHRKTPSKILPTPLDMSSAEKATGEALPKITEGSIAHIFSLPEDHSQNHSRRVYGKKNTMMTFPRSALAWSPTKITSSSRHNRTQSVDSVLDPLWSKNRIPVSRHRSKSSLTTHKCIDVFDTKKHHKQRIFFLLEMLDSSNVEVRRTASQEFGRLQCDDVHKHQLQEFLVGKLLQDCDTTVQYLGLKSLLSLGITDATVQDVTLKKLSQGSTPLQCDLLQLLNDLQQMGAVMDWSWCHSCLICLLSGAHGEVPLLAACILSYCQLERERCIAILLPFIFSSLPTNKNKALKCLVDCWQVKTAEVISAITTQLCDSSDWRLRLSAVQFLKTIGKHLLSSEENIFDILILKITNEPMQTVKQAIGQLLANMDMDRKAQKLFLERLKSADETTRAESAIALRAFDLKGPRIAQMILDFFELDSSSYVRVQLIRTLGHMKCHSPEVVQRLAEKCRGSGTVVRECNIVLKRIKEHY